MQRCPYIHEMKERLLGTPAELERRTEVREALAPPRDRALEPTSDPLVGTIVKVSPPLAYRGPIALA